MRILGIDPGSNVTGFGVIEYEGGRLRHVAHGNLRPRRGAPLAERLARIHDGLLEAIRSQRPEVAAVERVFIAHSPRAALVLGQARGVALAAAAGAGLPVHEYSPAQVKRAAVGHGAAEKKQMQAMVALLLGLDRRPASDAADALALAICHAHAKRLAGVQPERSGARRRRARALSLAVRRMR